MDFILDTDHLTVMQMQSGLEFDHIQARLQAHAGAGLFTTIISFQEHVQGWLAYMNKARTPDRVVNGYVRLSSVLRDYCQAAVLSFDQAAQNRYVELEKLRLRIGTMDLRIASITLAARGTLLSRNLRDFCKVPGLVVEDWTKPL